MKYSELRNFTYGDLKNFTYGDLSLDKYELLAKAENGSIPLPADVQAKLRELCTELAEKLPEKKSFFSTLSIKNIGDSAKLLLTLVQIAKGLDDINIGMRIKQIYDFIQSQL